jgi:Domain of unknown function (DUF4280)
MGAMVTCSGSLAGVPAPYSVAPGKAVVAGGFPVATIQDAMPLVNIPSFGMCKMQGTPSPCVPAFAAPFTGGSPSVRIGDAPALNDESRLRCGRGGVVRFHSPGQFAAMIG